MYFKCLLAIGILCFSLLTYVFSSYINNIVFENIFFKFAYFNSAAFDHHSLQIFMELNLPIFFSTFRAGSSNNVSEVITCSNNVTSVSKEVCPLPPACFRS